MDTNNFSEISAEGELKDNIQIVWEELQFEIAMGGFGPEELLDGPS